MDEGFNVEPGAFCVILNGLKLPEIFIWRVSLRVLNL